MEGDPNHVFNEGKRIRAEIALKERIFFKKFFWFLIDIIELIFNVHFDLLNKV